MNEEFYCCNTMNIKSEKTLSPSPPPPPPPPQKSTLRQALPQVLAVCVKNVLLLGFGMTLGFPTILIPSLSGNDPNETISLGQEGISWIGSLNLICVPIGCLLSGSVTQPIGRRRAMQIVNIPFLTAWLLFHFATDVWHIFLALCITGLTGGILEAPVLTYVAEITQPHLRGMLSSTSTLAVCLGIILQFLLGTFLNWRTTVLISCIIPVTSFILLIFIPESPTWLISKNRFNDARKSLAWLRGWTTFDDIEVEFQELCKIGNTQTNAVDTKLTRNSETVPIIKKQYSLQLIMKKNFLWPYCLCVFVFFLGHFNGTAAILVYAVSIFNTLKSPIDQYYATILLGTVQMIGATVCVCVINRLGKRLMTFISLSGCGICLTIAATYAQISNIQYIDFNKNHTITEPTEINWIPTSCLILNFFFSNLCIKTLPWILIGEIYPNEIKSFASSLSAAMGYVIGFVAVKIFLVFVGVFTLPGVFWFYAAISFLGMTILYFVLPETEGKTLFEITEHFAGRTKLSNTTKRGVTNLAFQDDENRNCVDESHL